MNDSDANYSDSGKVTRGEPELDADAGSIHNDFFGDLVHSASALRQCRQSQRGSVDNSPLQKLAHPASRASLASACSQVTSMSEAEIESTDGGGNESMDDEPAVMTE